MKAAEIYRQWLNDYRAEKAISQNKEIEDGDLLDWLTVKVANGISIKPRQSSPALKCECELKLDACTMRCEHMISKMED